MKAFLKLFMIFIILYSTKIFSQRGNTIQISSGVMSARNSDKGILGTIQFNYNINDSFSLYTYSGIFYWNTNKVNYYAGQETANNLRNTYSEDNHKMIPFYIGSRYFFNNSSVFKPFVNIEIGFSYLIFNSYAFNQINNPDGTFTLEPGNKTEKKDTFFGAGVGIGASHDIGDNLELLLEFRFNTLKNANYEWLSSGRTLRTFQFGFAYKL